MAHLDVKKVGRIPDGGGWRIHGRDSDQAKAAGRAKSAGAKRGYVYLHSIVDGFSRLAYTEPLADEKGATAAAFLARAKDWFAAHGITHIHRVVTDNGACYRSGDFARIVGSQARHQKTKPYTPRHNGKVERYQRILAEELLYAREFTSEDSRSAAIADGTSTTTTTGHTAPPEASHPLHDSSEVSRTSSPHTSRWCPSRGSPWRPRAPPGRRRRCRRRPISTA